MSIIVVLALASGALQLLGYVYYIRGSVRDDIQPNPSTWLMFAYGTALLTVLEWDKDAVWTLLVLPVTCSILSIWVAWHCYRRGTIRWPEDREDQWSFASDLLLTFGYLFAWYLTGADWIEEAQRETAATWFLILSNATTFVAFIPMIRECWHNPSVERSQPWVWWTAAYAALTVLTVMEASWDWILLLYPVSNVVMHGLVAYLAWEKRVWPAVPQN